MTMNAMEISRTALDVEWQRLEVITQNLANANTSGTAAGETYRALRLISGPKTDFTAYLRGGTTLGKAPKGVAVYGLEPSRAAPRMVHEPGHPNADQNGFVRYPAVDHAGEMMLLVKTARVYEANLVALNIARQMYAKAAQLGGRA